MKKVIIADDHAIFRDGLSALLSNNGIEEVIQAEDAEQLKRVLEDHSDCPIILCDCKMPGDGPLSILAHVRQHYPHIKVLFVTGMEAVLLFQQLLGAGADGIAVKSGEISELLRAVELVGNGERYVPQSIQSQLDKASELFTNKEFVVLELLLQGLSNPQVAKRLFKSESTINTHRTNIMRKAQCSSVVQLVHFARDNGLYFDDKLHS